MPFAPISRIAKKAGAERVSQEAVELLTAAAEAYTEKLAKEANRFAAHAGRKTLKGEDVAAALGGSP